MTQVRGTFVILSPGHFCQPDWRSFNPSYSSLGILMLLSTSS